MRRLWFIAWFLAGLLVSAQGHCLPPLQLFVDITPPGGGLRLEPGRYAGPVIIRQPITIDGGGEAIIDGEGRGTVVTVRADGVTLRGLHLTGSGNVIDGVDAGLLLEANDALIENNRIDDTLFGIHLKQANGNTVRGNRISSKREELKLRGDGIRMWYSSDNLIEGNELVDVRDFLVINSPDNRIFGNTVRGSGVSLQLVFAPGHEVAGNHFSDNATGVVVLYSDDNTIRNNRMLHLRSPSGAALAVKDSSGVVVEENEILHCAVGIEANAPTHPENTIQLNRNRFAYNDVAMYFYGEKGGHVIHGNRFEQNLLDIAVSAASSAFANDWRGNYWDNYQGFDRDHDGFGDTPHDIYIYSDRIWMDRPRTRFFRGSTVMEMVDFIERLVPFSAPEHILRDPAPLIR